jgi:hypothetical protein
MNDDTPNNSFNNPEPTKKAKDLNQTNPKVKDPNKPPKQAGNKIKDPNKPPKQIQSNKVKDPV